MATTSPARAYGGAITGINVTPLVDVTLVLLVVFMVTAKVIVRQHTLPVDLPRAASGAPVQLVFSVVVASDGRAEVDGQALASDDAILARARAAVQANPDLRAVLLADGAVPHRRIMQILDRLKLAGVTRIGFGVVPEDALSGGR